MTRRIVLVAPLVLAAACVHRLPAPKVALCGYGILPTGEFSGYMDFPGIKSEALPIHWSITAHEDKYHFKTTVVGDPHGEYEYDVIDQGINFLIVPAGTAGGDTGTMTCDDRNCQLTCLSHWGDDYEAETFSRDVITVVAYRENTQGIAWRTYDLRRDGSDNRAP